MSEESVFASTSISKEKWSERKEKIGINLTVFLGTTHSFSVLGLNQKIANRMRSVSTFCWGVKEIVIRK